MRWLLSMLVLALVGCQCQGTTRALTLEPVDFGEVTMGSRASSVLRVTNTGNSPLTLGSLLLTGSPAFSFAFAQRVLEPGERAELAVVFDAPRDSGQAWVTHTATLTLRTTTREVVEALVTGVAVVEACELPAVLDFGGVARGDSSSRALELKNALPFPGVASVGAVTSTSGDDTAFSFADPNGEVPLGASEAKAFSISFAPTETKAYQALVPIRRLARCPEKWVKLIGVGFDVVLTWAPSTLDFDFVPLGATRAAGLVFRNHGFAGVTLSGPRFSLNDYRVASSPPLVVPPAARASDGALVPGELALSLSFTPALLGPRKARFDFDTSLARQAAGLAQLTGSGGGPELEVTPATLDFGRVATFAGAPAATTRRLRVSNQGTSNLHPRPPVVSVSPSPEFQVAVNPLAPWPADGLVPGPGFVEVTVTFTPASPGLKSATVTVYSDDFDEGTAQIPVTAEVVVLPPCTYAVDPGALDFGLVSPPKSKRLWFTLKNLGQSPGDVCLVSDLRVPLGSDPAFALTAGPLAAKELAPGEALDVEVLAAPNAMGATPLWPALGAVEFFVSSPLAPLARVPLKATIAASCLTVSPEQLNFGTVKTGCGSATRTVGLYNGCTVAVSVDGVALAAGAPGFALVQVPGLPATLAPFAAPLTFQVKYQPPAAGHHTGAVEVRAGGQRHLVTLAGDGDGLGHNTDTFTQRPAPVADILLAIDGSCSMASQQPALATNLPTLLAMLTADAADFHLAVIDAQLFGGSYPYAELLSGPTHPARVLAPQTPGLAGQFASRIQLALGGGAEDCFAPVISALTAPLAVTTNRGFLRGAPLAVACVTDIAGGSPWTAAHFSAALRNIQGEATFSLVAPLANGTCGPLLNDVQYPNAVAATGGSTQELCDADWTPGLRRFANVGYAPRVRFPLTAVPFSPVSVTVDGLVVPPSAWSFDALGNAVVFGPGAVPAPGAKVEVGYDVACF